MQGRIQVFSLGGATGRAKRGRLVVADRNCELARKVRRDASEPRAPVFSEVQGGAPVGVQGAKPLENFCTFKPFLCMDIG